MHFTFAKLKPASSGIVGQAGAATKQLTGDWHDWISGNYSARYDDDRFHRVLQEQKSGGPNRAVINDSQYEVPRSFNTPPPDLKEEYENVPLGPEDSSGVYYAATHPADKLRNNKDTKHIRCFPEFRYLYDEYYCFSQQSENEKQAWRYVEAAWDESDLPPPLNPVWSSNSSASGSQADTANATKVGDHDPSTTYVHNNPVNTSEHSSNSNNNSPDLGFYPKSPQYVPGDPDWDGLLTNTAAAELNVPLPRDYGCSSAYIDNSVSENCIFMPYNTDYREWAAPQCLTDSISGIDTAMTDVFDIEQSDVHQECDVTGDDEDMHRVLKGAWIEKQKKQRKPCTKRPWEGRRPTTRSTSDSMLYQLDARGNIETQPQGLRRSLRLQSKHSSTAALSDSLAITKTPKIELSTKIRKARS